MVYLEWVLLFGVANVLFLLYAFLIGCLGILTFLLCVSLWDVLIRTVCAFVEWFRKEFRSLKEFVFRRIVRVFE